MRINQRQDFLVSGCFLTGHIGRMGEFTVENLKLYEINHTYINYLLPFAPHLFQNKKVHQQNERKYIGIILRVNEMNYFAPLSSFKEKHRKMKEGLDFIKIKDYAVINLNNMFPVPDTEYTYVEIAKERNFQYRTLLQAEYRFIKSIQDNIRKNAAVLYTHKIQNGNATALAKRCNDFLLLEEVCKKFAR